MIETLYTQHHDRRYVVSFAGKIKLVTYNRLHADTLNVEIAKHKNPGEYWLIVSKQTRK